VTFSCAAASSLPLLLPFAVGLEGRALLDSSVWHVREDALIAIVGTVSVGLSSFLLILLEMAIVRRTSALTTDVLGYVKNVTLIVLAGLTFDEGLSPMNVVGVVVTFTAAFVYSALKTSQHHGGQLKANDAQAAYEILSVLELSHNWEEDDDDGDVDDDEDGSGDGAATTGDSPSSNVDTDPVALHRVGGGGSAKSASGQRRGRGSGGRRGVSSVGAPLSPGAPSEDDDTDDVGRPLVLGVRGGGGGVGGGGGGGGGGGDGGRGGDRAASHSKGALGSAAVLPLISPRGGVGPVSAPGSGDSDVDMDVSGSLVLGSTSCADDAFLVLDRSRASTSAAGLGSPPHRGHPGSGLGESQEGGSDEEGLFGSPASPSLGDLLAEVGR
jgi:hypothetical protein